MKKILTVSIVVVSLFAIFLSTWIVRGFFDEIFMMDGVIHVINHTDHDHIVSLRFASGKEISVNLKKRASANTRVSDSGEGGIFISIDGQLADVVGYVTSLNSPIVLCIEKDSVEFSQIFTP